MWIWLIIAALLGLIARYLSQPRRPRKVEPPIAAEPEPDPIQLPIEDFIDLHPFRPEEILDVVDSYLKEAREKGFVQVRLIHGKGRGVQRAQIQERLETHPLVSSFEDAPPGRGGWGATEVVLRNSRRRPTRSRKR